MKNIFKKDLSIPLDIVSKRHFKLYASIFLFGFSSICASDALAQSKKVSIIGNNVSLEQAIQEIEKKSGYLFVYDTKEVNLNKKVTVNAKDKTVKSILEQMLANTGISFYEEGNNIVLTKTTNKKKINVKGKIVDFKGEPVIGATVKEQGTTNGTITDFDGNFKLTVKEGSSLFVSYVGYQDKSVKAVIGKDILVTLLEDTEMLEEVVVVGYGTQKKVNLTGAVESVELSKAKGRAYTNVSSMLQGNVAGAFISQTSGQPGNDGATIQIRGIGTFNNTSPLVIIDGMEGNLDAVNPKDIESVSVLKDAASCAIYGNRASNGVVLITTKQGDLNSMNIEYNGLVGVQKATSLPDVLKGIDYLDLKAEAYKNTNKSWPTWYTEEYMNNYRNHVDEYMYPTNYSWMDDTYHTAMITDHYMSISGGNKSLKYSTSAGYLYQNGIVRGNNAKKFTFRSNVSASFFEDKLRLNVSLSTHQKTKNDLVDGAHSAIYSSYVAPPTIRMTLPGVGYNNAGYSFGAMDAGGFNRTKETPLTLNASINATLMKGLTLNLYGGIDNHTSENKNFKPTVQLFGFNDDGTMSTPQPRESSLHYEQSKTTMYVLNGQLNYNTVIAKKHNVNLMAGYEMREYSWNWHSMDRKNLTVNLPEFPVGDPKTQLNDSKAHELAWMSYYGRLNYMFDNRYMFEFNLRYDGSSRFIDKWGVFPSVSGAWRISEEKFMKNVTWLDNLKLRLSYGKLGNESIGQQYAASDELSLNGKYNFNNSLVGMAAVTKLANKKTSWESSEQYNIGLDFDIFKRVSATIDYYIKNTTDILMQVPVSGTLGMSTVPYQNAGKMQNRGLEMTVRYNDRFGKVGTHFSASATRVYNKVQDLAGKDELIMSDHIWRVNEPFNSLYGLQTEGIYQSEEEIKNHLIFSKNGTALNPYMGMKPEPGDIRFVDQLTIDTNGDGIPDTRDGVINEDDKVIIGNTFPKWTFSATLGFEWNGFDASIFLQGVAGMKALNQGIITVPFFGGESNTGAWYKDRWTPERPSQTVQRLYSEPGRSEVVSEYYLEDASYIRCKSLDLGYTVPKKVLKKVFKNTPSIRVYVSLQNLFTITDMRYGFDPEKPSHLTNTLQYPQAKTYSFGVNMKF